MEPIIFTSSLLFGREVVGQTITNSTKTILSSVSSILEDEDFLFKKILKDYDLTHKVEIITCYVKKISEDEKIFENNAIKLSINNILEILKKISSEVEIIKKKIKEHNTLWLHRFRTPEYKILLINLESDIKILTNRFDLLIKIKN